MIGSPLNTIDWGAALKVGFRPKADIAWHFMCSDKAGALDLVIHLIVSRTQHG